MGGGGCTVRCAKSRLFSTTGRILHPTAPAGAPGIFFFHLMLATGPRALDSAPPMRFGMDHACCCRGVACRGVPGMNIVIIGAVRKRPQGSTHTHTTSSGAHWTTRANPPPPPAASCHTVTGTPVSPPPTATAVPSTHQHVPPPPHTQRFSARGGRPGPWGPPERPSVLLV